MAKNFGQYDEENPVMAILGKAKLEEEMSKSEKNQTENKAEIISSQNAENQNLNTQGNSDSEKKAAVQVQVQNQTSESDENGAAETESAEKEIKKILVNISIRETTKKDWKMFFLKHDLTMTQGIETAVEYLKAEVEKGHIRLSKGGVTK